MAAYRRQSFGCSRVFDNVKSLQDDNGERFFMQYYHQQKERTKFRVDDGTESKRCQCDSCAGGESAAAAAAPAPAPASVPALPAANPMAVLQLQYIMAIQAAQAQQK